MRIELLLEKSDCETKARITGQVQSDGNAGVKQKRSVREDADSLKGYVVE